VTAHGSPLAWFAIVCAAAAAAILITYLVRRPPAFDRATKVWLLLGLGVFPIGVALGGNIEGYRATQTRAFCGSCHVMGAHAADANDAESRSLASRHSRNRFFGGESCYACHADYGMYGTIVTKIGGLRHVWLYYTQYKDVPLEEAKKTIHVIKPYSNATCMECHSTRLDVWQSVPDHASSLDDVRAGRVSCASGGCHGFAHPFTKPASGEKR